LQRDGFLTGDYAAKLALVKELGRGIDEDAAKNGKTFGVLKRDQCYWVRREFIHDGSIWFMVDNGKRGTNLGHVTLSLVANHYKSNDAKRPPNRDALRVKNYDPFEFDISPDITKADPSLRPVFYANVDDTGLIVLDVKSDNNAFKAAIAGKYYIMIDDRIAYENLVPGCRFERVGYP